jgi:hypothetical protein
VCLEVRCHGNAERALYQRGLPQSSLTNSNNISKDREDTSLELNIFQHQIRNIPDITVVQKPGARSVTNLITRHVGSRLRCTRVEAII